MKRLATTRAAGRRPRTYARQAIADILDDFRRLEHYMAERTTGDRSSRCSLDHISRVRPTVPSEAPPSPTTPTSTPSRRRRLLRQRPPQFETMADDANLLAGSTRRSRGGAPGAPSCGETMLCFASLFLNTAQLRDNGAFDVITGGMARQMYNLPNWTWTAAAIHYYRASRAAFRFSAVRAFATLTPRATSSDTSRAASSDTASSSSSASTFPSVAERAGGVSPSLPPPPPPPPWRAGDTRGGLKSTWAATAASSVSSVSSFVVGTHRGRSGDAVRQLERELRADDGT